MKYSITASRAQKYVWFRVAKVATRSILRSLRHSTDIDFNKYNQLYDSTWDDRFKFAFVRNPWDRLLSCYINKVECRHEQCSASAMPRVWPRHALEGPYKKAEGLSFSEFVLKFISSQDLQKCNIHHRLQSKLIHPHNMDFIGKFENLQEDFDVVCDKIGISRHRLPHLHKSTHKYYTDYYNDEIKEAVAELYKSDIEAFGYEF